MDWETLIPPDCDVEFDEDDATSLHAKIKDLRRKYWWPCRRSMLEIGVDVQTYVYERAKFRKAFARFAQLYCPPIVFRIVKKS